MFEEDLIRFLKEKKDKENLFKTVNFRLISYGFKLENVVPQIFRLNGTVSFSPQKMLPT